MSFTQLASPLPVDIAGKGKGTAFAVIDYGPEQTLVWVSALEDSGEICCAPNPAVRLRGSLPGLLVRSTDEVGDPRTVRWSAREALPDASVRDRDPRAAHRVQALSIPGADAEHAAFP